MRKLFVSIFIITSIFSCTKKQKGFVIQGKVTDFKDSTLLYLTDPETQENLDSCYIVKNKFTFKGTVDEPTRFFVSTKFNKDEEYKYTSFFVENTNIKLIANYSNFRYPKITGSESEDISQKLTVKIMANDILRDSLTKHYMKNRQSYSELERDQLWKRIYKIDSINDIEYVNFMNAKLNSYPALEILSWRMNDISKDSLAWYYDQLIPKFKNSKKGKLINIYLNARTVEIGEKFIDFEAKTINGEPFKLSHVKTDYILLDFWAAGCGPCRMANKNFAKHYSEFKDKMEIVSFSMDVKKELFINASKKDSITWINVTDHKGNNSETVIQYKVSGIPCAYLIDKDRNVIKNFVGYNPDHIEELKDIIGL